METIPWFWVWTILAAIFLVGEMLSLSFFMLPFAVGAVLAAIFNAIGLDLAWQITIFIVASVVSLIALRPFAKRITRKSSDIKVGAERLVGMQGKVVEGKSQAGQFRVVVEGEPWNAFTEDDVQLDLETDIEVLAVDSNSLLVRKLSSELSPQSSE